MSNKEIKAYSTKLEAQAKWMTALSKVLIAISSLIGTIAGIILLIR